MLRAGAVLVTVSPSATAAEVEHFVADCTPVLALTDADGRGRVPPGVPDLAIVELIERAACAVSRARRGCLCRTCAPTPTR